MTDKMEFYSMSLTIWRRIEAANNLKAISEIDFDRPILDLGCGNGTASSLVFTQLDIGIDLPPELVKEAKSSKIYSDLLVGDGCRLPLKDESIGLVFSNCVLEHILNIDNVIDEISRILKRDGYLIFTVPSENFSKYLFYVIFFNALRLKSLSSKYGSLRNKRSQHHNILSFGTWENKLSKSGFKIVESWCFLPKPAVMLWDFLTSLEFFLRTTKITKRLHSEKIETVIVGKYSGKSSDGGALLVIAKKR